MKPKQSLTIKVIFETEHSPGHEGHLKEVLDNYFKGKGVQFDMENLNIIIQ